MHMVLTEEGRSYAENGLPENRLMDLLEGGPKDSEIIRHSLEKDFPVALHWAKKNGWINVKGGKIIKTMNERNNELESALKMVLSGCPVDKTLADVLTERKLVVAEREDIVKRAGKMIGKEIGVLTEDLIKTGLWKEVKFKPYNINAAGQKIYPGKKQPYAVFLDWVKMKMISLGFEEMTGPLVETEFWNMDALYMPQHHSARDIHDAYFLKYPKYAKSLDQKLLAAVKESHEKGAGQSRGWQYQYDVKRAHRLILRTHDTSISPRTLSSKNLKIPGKYFQIARCFRYDVIDAKHLPDFNQLGGFVIEDGINFRHLAGLLKLFATEFAGVDKIKLVPGYFPFTEPSVEMMVKHPTLGWMELAGAGIFRQEMLIPLGVKKPVIAWGIGIDRLAMLKLGIDDIRDLFTHDLKYLRDSKVL